MSLNSAGGSTLQLRAGRGLTWTFTLPPPSTKSSQSKDHSELPGRRVEA